MVRFFVQWKFTILLALALVDVVAVPLMGNAEGVKLFLTLSLTAVLVTAAFTVSKGKKLAGALVLMLPCLVFLWWVYIYTPGPEMEVASSVLQSLFIAYMILMILAAVLQAGRVTVDVISAAIVAYLFLVFFFGKLYLILEMLYPGSFSLPQGNMVHDPGLWEYFSMITLSTLGYGDIVPVTSRARVMAGGEAMIGQIYLAVLIARLVSIYGNTPAEEGRDG